MIYCLFVPSFIVMMIKKITLKNILFIKRQNMKDIIFVVSFCFISIGKKYALKRMMKYIERHMPYLMS